MGEARQNGRKLLGGSDSARVEACNTDGDDDVIASPAWSAGDTWQAAA